MDRDAGGKADGLGRRRRKRLQTPVRGELQNRRLVHCERVPFTVNGDIGKLDEIGLFTVNEIIFTVNEITLRCGAAFTPPGSLGTQGVGVNANIFGTSVETVAADDTRASASEWPSAWRLWSPSRRGQNF